MLHELILAVRTLSKRLSYSLAVVATLALGIGATTVMFSVADAALLRPLPFSDPDRLVFLTGVAGSQRSPRGGSFLEVADWRALNKTLEDVSHYDYTPLNLRIGADVERIEAEMVNAGFFRLLGVQPALGRTFLPEEDTVPDRNTVVVVSHALWRERFGGDAGVLNRTLQLNDRTFTIVGVMPEGFAGVSFDTDVWVPSMMVTLTATPSIVQNRSSRWLGAIGRLRNGIPIERAQEDLNRVAALLEERHPETNRERGVQLNVMRDAMLGNTRGMITALFGAVFLLMLVACANVAGLQLARAASMRRELAVRLALGARRWHVLRQLLVESLVLALAAGTAGTLAASWALGSLMALMPAGALPPQVNPSIDPRAIAFALVMAVAGGLLVAVLPAMAAMRGDLAESMKGGTRAAGPGLGSIRRPSSQQALVVAEIALAMALLGAAGLMVRSLERQANVRLGFEPDAVTVAQLTMPAARYQPADRATFVERLAAELRQIPGVNAAAVATSLPFTGSVTASILVPEGATAEDAGRRYFRNSVTKDFFSALGITIVRGRAFTDSDRAGAPLVAVINAGSARQLWGTIDVVGRRFRLANAEGPAVEIVGVAADARFRDLTTDLSAARVEPDVYFPYAQRPDRDIELAVQSKGTNAISLADLQHAVAVVDPGLPLYRVQRLNDAVRQQTATPRFGSALLTIFSGGALMLAAVGLYSLIAYVVGLSRKEIGIRLALGADSRRIVTLIVGKAMALVAVGLALGLAGAIAAGRALESQLFQTPAVDPAAFGMVALLLIIVSVIASLIPTRRAARVDAQAALRTE
jgi:predicted permease